jgi:CRISPR-associated protein (TIGR02584 family)
MPPPRPRPYSLLAVLGTSPAVVTEIIWKLAHEPQPLRPVEVHLVTTSSGKQTLTEALLTPDAAGQTVWTQLGAAAGIPLPDEPTIHVPRRPGEYADLDDLRTGDDAALVADLLFDLVERLTAEDRPLVASIAGGRKTMSADLQSAFSLRARPLDRLVHVLASEELEHRHRKDPTAPAFYFPATEGEARAVEVVEVRTPLLRRVLNERLFKEDTTDRSRGALLRALEPLNHAHAPATAVLTLGKGKRGASELEVFDAVGASMGTLSIPGRLAVGLAVLAEAFAENPDGAQPAGLIGRASAANKRREEIADLGNAGVLNPWMLEKDVSDVVSDLHKKQLARFQPAMDLLAIRGVRDGDRTYGWEAPKPRPLTVRLRDNADAANRTKLQAVLPLTAVERHEADA